MLNYQAAKATEKQAESGAVPMVKMSPPDMGDDSRA